MPIDFIPHFFHNPKTNIQQNASQRYFFGFRGKSDTFVKTVNIDDSKANYDEITITENPLEHSKKQAKT